MKLKKKNLFINKLLFIYPKKFLFISMSQPETSEPYQRLTIFHKFNTVVFLSPSSKKGLTLKPDSPRTKEAVLLLGLQPNFYEMKLFL